MQVVIMAGGKGTRISSLYHDIPKPMIKINGCPILEYELAQLRDQGLKDIIITVSHLGDQIIDYFGDGSKISPFTGQPFGVNIQYYNEETPLGNAGALFKIRDKLSDDFLLINADSIFDIDFNRFIESHRQSQCLATIFTHPNSHPYDSGLIIADTEHKVISWLAKEDPRPEFYENRVNAGVHIISPKILDQSGIKADLIGTKNADGKVFKVDLDRDILKPLAGSGLLQCYDSPEYVKDMGTPDRLLSVTADMESGLVNRKNLRNTQKAIFLDRDGTINKYVGFLKDISDFELIPGISQAIKRINNSDYLAIVVTNQPVIARGDVTVDELNNIHNKLQTLLGNDGAFVNAIYYCPHHPDKGFKGEIPELKFDCACRKPKPGMLLKAAEDFNIDLSQSYMIGDSDIDVVAGNSANCKSYKVKTNQEGDLNKVLDYIGL